MGDKGKGKDTKNLKKPKVRKGGNRPHEQREREGLHKPVGLTASRS